MLAVLVPKCPLWEILSSKYGDKFSIWWRVSCTAPELLTSPVKKSHASLHLLPPHYALFMYFYPKHSRYLNYEKWGANRRISSPIFLSIEINKTYIFVWYPYQGLFILFYWFFLFYFLLFILPRCLVSCYTVARVFSFLLRREVINMVNDSTKDERLIVAVWKQLKFCWIVAGKCNVR